MAVWTSGSSYLRPISRLTEKIVFSGLVTACRLAVWPTYLSPLRGLRATTEGVMRPPSLFSSTVGSPASMTAIHELVVPKSMPNTLAILFPSYWSRLESCQYCPLLLLLLELLIGERQIEQVFQVSALDASVVPAMDISVNI